MTVVVPGDLIGDQRPEIGEGDGSGAVVFRFRVGTVSRVGTGASGVLGDFLAKVPECPLDRLCLTVIRSGPPDLDTELGEDAGRLVILDLEPVPGR